MAVQNSIYITDGATRTFPSTKHIATKQHVAVRGKRVFDSAWEYIEPEVFNLVNNSIVFLTAPATSIYSQIEIRVADDYDELASQPNDISAVAQYLTEIGVVADNIDSIVAASKGEYLTYGLPSTANCGDLSVDTLTGGIYQWNCDTSAWDLVGKSGSEISGVTPLGVNIVTGLPTVGENGEIIFNQADGYLYGYINGVWRPMISTPVATDQVGIEVVATDPTTDNYEGRVIFNTTLNQLRKFTSGSWIQVVEPTTAATEVADASLTVAKFAAGIRPVEIFDTLPTTGNSIGRLVYLTTDGLVYRYTASGFTPSIPTTALIGTITETQIADDAITTPKIATGAITTDTIAANAITSSHISSNSITTGMIQAGAIGATQIASNAITADKINAGAVTATKIAALSIDASKIIAGSIGADQLAANSITAGKIAAGAVSANNIAAGTITATQIATGTITSAKLAAYSITADKLDVGALDGKSANFSGSRGTADAGTWTIAATNPITGATNGGIHGVGYGYGVVGRSSNGIGVYGYSISGTGIVGKGTGWGIYAETSASGGQWGFITYNKCYAGGGYSPFTGSHIVTCTEELTVGEVVYCVRASVKDIDNANIIVSKTDNPNNPKVIGVVSFVGENDIEINALGEGGILVCSDNGNIDNGDYLTSSYTKGYAMKQDDDLLHNYTVAKALEAVDWSKEKSNIKMIACTYHCG